MKDKQRAEDNAKLIKALPDWFIQEKALLIFLSITSILMLYSIVWVYHIKVLNAPKVYSDGFGYYIYLPALLYGDFTFGFVESGGWEHPLSLINIAGNMINKYPIGVAIMESPFFFAAHLLSLLRDALTGSATATGYTNLYQYMVLFACVIITYGTNLFHYASYDACFFHIYSFFYLIYFYIISVGMRNGMQKRKIDYGRLAYLVFLQD